MNSELRPSCSIGLQRARTNSRSHQKANGIATVRRPARIAKNAGDPPQKSEGAYGLARNDAAYADAEAASPAIANHFSTRCSCSDVRAASSATPTKPPAKTNPAHGKMEKVARPWSGRM